LKTQES